MYICTKNCTYILCISSYKYISKCIAYQLRNSTHTHMHCDEILQTKNPRKTYPFQLVCSCAHSALSTKWRPAVSAKCQKVITVVVCRKIWIGNQGLDDFGMSPTCGIEQRGPTVSILRIHQSTMIKQHLHHLTAHAFWSTLNLTFSWILINFESIPNRKIAHKLHSNLGEDAKHIWWRQVRMNGLTHPWLSNWRGTISSWQAASLFSGVRHPCGQAFLKSGVGILWLKNWNWKTWFKLQTLETEKLGHIYDIAHDNLILSIFFSV